MIATGFVSKIEVKQYLKLKVHNNNKLDKSFY
jgi:hypothetical protein